MKRIALMLLLSMFAIGASANRSYGIALRRWYNASEYFKEGMLNFYLEEDKIYFRIGTDEWTTTFTVDGVKRDDFVYMMLEKDNTFRERKDFIYDYLDWMSKNLPDGTFTVYNDGGRGSSYSRSKESIPEWDSNYRRYMIERGWYKNEGPKPVAQSNHGIVQELDPLADFVPVLEIPEKINGQDTKPAHEDGKTAKTSPSNNTKTTNSKTSSSAKSTAMSSSYGLTTSSASNTSSSSSKENGEEEGGNSLAAWAIIIGGLYYMFGRGKKKEIKTDEQKKMEEEKRRKEKRQREAAARRREEKRRIEEQRKFMEGCYYDEWQKKNQSGWGS